MKARKPSLGELLCGCEGVDVREPPPDSVALALVEGAPLDRRAHVRLELTARRVGRQVLRVRGASEELQRPGLAHLQYVQYVHTWPQAQQGIAYSFTATLLVNRTFIGSWLSRSIDLGQVRQ